MTEYPQLFRFKKPRSDKFKDITKKLKINLATEPDYHDLLNDELVEPIKGTSKIIVPEEQLNKLDIARIIYKALKPAIGNGASYEELLDDRGLWEWLSIAFWHHIGVRGNYSGGELIRYSPPLNGESDYYRHLLRTPVLLYERFEDDPKSLSFFLKRPCNEGGDSTESWTQNKTMLSPGVNHLLCHLYFDDENQCLRRGHANKKPGDHRHLVGVLKQLRATFFVEDMEKDDLLNLLPDEFTDRLKNSNN